MRAHSRPKPSRRIPILLAGLAALLIAQLGPTPAVADPGTVLIYGPSMDTETPNEQTVAHSQGHTVTVVSATEWAAMTTAQFSAFDALVIGDGGCDEDLVDLDTVRDTRQTWSPAVTGNITLNGFDPFAHEDEVEGQRLVANSLNFAAGSQAGRTGLFFSLGCWYEDMGNPVTIMDQFGTFTADAENNNAVDILVPTHPVMAGLTEAGLSDWGNSTHAQFTAFPTSFQPLANDVDADPDKPVILAFTAPPPPTCKGQTATLVGDAAADVLTGTSGRDVITGLEGNDRINAGGGKDLVCGGVGKDTLKGGAGKDTLLGQKGRDRLAGGAGRGDVCKGGPGKDTVKASCERGRA